MPEESIEQAAINQWYGQNQQQAQAAYGTTIDNYAVDNELSTVKGDTMATQLNEQADSLTGANEILTNLKKKGKYDSQASYAAAVEKGINEKMRAYGMLDKTRDVVDEVASRMTADYIDPVTGEKVTVDTAPNVSDEAYSNAWDATVDEANSAFYGASGEKYAYMDQSNEEYWGLTPEDEWAGSYEPGGPLEGEQYSNTNPFGPLPWQLTSEQYQPTEAFFNDAFGEAGSSMYETHQEFRLDMSLLRPNMEEAIATNATTGQAALLQARDDETAIRQETATNHAKSYNDSEARAYKEKEALAGEAAKSQRDIQQSIKTDKQTLARAGHGRIEDEEVSSSVDFSGGGGGRPT